MLAIRGDEPDKEESAGVNRFYGDWGSGLGRSTGLVAEPVTPICEGSTIFTVRYRRSVWAPGLPTADLCRKHGPSLATFYKPKAKYGGMDLSDAKRLKQFEDENAKLKRLVADVMLDNVVSRDLPEKP